MESGLDRGKLIVGARQSLKAMKNGKVTEAYIADDADESITKDFMNECIIREIDVIRYNTMIELGRDCGIEIGAAVACRINK